MSVYSKPPAEIRHENYQRNMAARGRMADCNNHLATKSAVTFHHEGTLLEVHGTQHVEQFEKPPKKKGKCRGFSNKSRLAMMRTALRLKKDVGMPCMVTLTYPGKASEKWPNIWPDDPKIWKEQLRAFFERLEWHHDKAATLWKLEYQKRGAPHFHLLVFNVPYLPCSLVARWWFEIVGSNDPHHLEAGVEVQRVRSLNGVLCYVGKAYMGKAVEGGAEVGRFWGIRNRKHYPFSAKVRIRCKRGTAIMLRRTIKRLMRSKGYRKCRGMSYVVSKRLDQWAQWAEMCELFFERDPF